MHRSSPALLLLAACGTAPVEAPSVAARVDADRLASDLRFVARPRPPRSPVWTAVQDACAERFEAAGLEVERMDYGTGVNVIGTRPGRIDTPVVLAAHYDHIPGCAGADDNASGVAGLWALADTVGPGDRTLVLACLDQEEWGLIGAHALAARLADTPVHAMLSVEMIAFTDDRPGSQRIPTGFEYAFRSAWGEVRDREFRGDFLLYVGDWGSSHVGEALRAGGHAAGLPVIGFTNPIAQYVPQLARSDHAAFWDQGLPGVMVTDTADFRYPAYHCRSGPDVVENLDSIFHAKAVETLLHATERLLRE
ncbi:MAG: hypothetical protein ACI8PZ_002039 [Myxococcota bacterium]